MNHIIHKKIMIKNQMIRKQASEEIIAQECKW